MSNTIKGVCYNSMEKILTGRPYDDALKTRYVEMIAEDILDHLKMYSTAYSYYVTTVLMNRKAHAWIHQRSYYHADDDFHIRSEFNNDQWNGYSFVFAFSKENRFSCVDIFQNHMDNVQDLIYKYMEKYLYGKEIYDSTVSKISIMNIADSLLDSLIPILHNFSFGINLYTAAKNCGSCSYSCGLCFPEDGSACQVFQNPGYFSCCHVVAFVN